MSALRARREALGLSVDAVAERAGVSRRTVQRVELGGASADARAAVAAVLAPVEPERTPIAGMTDDEQRGWQALAAASFEEAHRPRVERPLSPEQVFALAAEEAHR